MRPGGLNAAMPEHDGLPACPVVRGEGAKVRSIHSVALGDRAGGFDITLNGDRVESVALAATGATPQWLAMPAFVNLHAHANRAFTAPARHPSSLADAVEAARQERATATADDSRDRAKRLFERSLLHGTARIRTHTDVDTTTGMRAMEGVLTAAREIGDAIDVEIVAFANASADPARLTTRDLLTEAVRLGAKLIGAVPALCVEPLRAVDAVLDLAVHLDVEVDFHLDEHLEVGASLLERVAKATLEHGMHGRVTVSHACVLAAMSDDAASRTLERMAEARITLVVLPELNLYLQGRSSGSPRERGIAPVLEALRAGVPVRFGTDNVRDWFFPFGDADLLETGYIGALGSHLDAPKELTAALCGGRQGVRVGDMADLVLIPASSFDDALARRPGGRLLIRRGRQISSRE